VLTGVEIDVSKFSGAGAESESEKYDSAHLLLGFQNSPIYSTLVWPMASGNS